MHYKIKEGLLYVIKSEFCFSVSYLMMAFFTLLTLFPVYMLFAKCILSSEVDSRPQWTWQCVDGKCVKVPSGVVVSLSLPACQLQCDPWAGLWPRPRELSRQGGQLERVRSDSRILAAEGLPKDSPMMLQVKQVARGFQDKLLKGGSSFSSDHYLVSVFISVPDTEVGYIGMGTSEEYSLIITPKKYGEIRVDIKAKTFFGVRHALETLSQLVVYDEFNEEVFMLTGITIKDWPAFRHRGILLDTSRSYFSVNAIKRTIRAMAKNKLNTFHWHITDSQSFPFVSETFPKLSQYGAYTQEKVYTSEDIESLVEYARDHGVRIIPEFDAPAHVGEGWQWVGGNATVCFKANPWSQYCVEPPCGQLNPGSERMYQVLSGIYKDMLSLFKSDVFHMGGDEVNMNCWNTSDAVTDWMKRNRIPRTEEGLLQVWDRFQSRAYSLLVQANKKKELPVILWTSTLTEKDNIDKYLEKKRYIIQIWTRGTDAVIPELINKGYRIILSNYDALYFDCGFGAWVGSGNNWCSPYIGWQKVYDNNVWDLLKSAGIDVKKGSKAKELVLGSEAALWTEQADESVLDARLWPRAAALAERLWSDPSEGWSAAENRLLLQRERLVEDGIKADVIQPEWCLKNQGYCYA